VNKLEFTKKINEQSLNILSSSIISTSSDPVWIKEKKKKKKGTELEHLILGSALLSSITTLPLTLPKAWKLLIKLLLFIHLNTLSLSQVHQLYFGFL